MKQNKKEELISGLAIRSTKARAEILDTLVKATKPLCYDEFTLSMDKATFYRNISKFEEEGIVGKFESDDKKWYFEIMEKPHAHFICKVCKKIECIESVEPKMDGYRIESAIFKGVCPTCAGL